MGQLTQFFSDVRARVDGRLQRFFEHKRREALATSPLAHELSDAVAELTMRGGKRLRAAALEAAFRAVNGEVELSGAADAQAALELLQTYLLIQDDWMDGDLERRGGPSVHAALTSTYGDANLGANLAILAADVACGYAWELISAAPATAARLREVLATFGRMHYEVVCGQQLDLLGHPDVSLVHELKTGSYTVRGPFAIGGLLGDAKPEQLATLDRFGRPLGMAFQLRDDLLSAFGDERATGKPVGNDLRAGKHSAVLDDVRKHGDAEVRAALDAVVGNAAATEPEIARALAALRGSGARERVEARLQGLFDEAKGALKGAPLRSEGVELLLGVADLLVNRDR